MKREREKKTKQKNREEVEKSNVSKILPKLFSHDIVDKKIKYTLPIHRKTFEWFTSTF